MQCAQFRSLQSHLRVCSCRALARMPGRGARTTPAARVIAGSTRLTNAKRTCGGLVDFASKITQARPTVMRDDKPGGTISASVKTKSPCPSDRGYHSADLPSELRCDPTHILACRSVISNRWRRPRSENRYEETSGNRCLAHRHNCRGFLLHGECLHGHLRRISMQPVESNAGPLVRPHRLVAR